MKSVLEKYHYRNKKERCFILGTGISLNDADLAYLDDEITIGVNQICLAKIPDFIVVGDNECLLHNEALIFNDETKKNCKFVFVSNGAGITLPKRFYIDNSRVIRSIEEIEYFIDDELITSSNTGGSTVQDIAIPLACWLGFIEINLLGCDGGFRHFFNPAGTDGTVSALEQKHGKTRPRQRWNLVQKELAKREIKLYNCSNINNNKEIEYRKYESIFK
tara:strand:- start:1976 stop:2632 length:657 start_codon:yes stop_codon:yes gene_type:complete